ncbi:MAG: hypothetical protein LPK45_08870 [Bacteroidota bacterium]|nr:hypothetical protein [Bacteroidota bacterium]MDX5431196.1 hypothetical protein [Bacteroidota bacterium]MDX5469935.1 hypothetical protein [Bacteroidota bacterium]
MKKLTTILFLIATLGACHCNDECVIPDPCEDCYKKNKICVDNHCECPEGYIEYNGMPCTEKKEGILQAESLKGTPLECFSSMVLEFKPQTSSTTGGLDLGFYYTLKDGSRTVGGGGGLNAQYIVGIETDVLIDDWADLSFRSCDSLSAVANNVRFHGIYYKNLKVMDAQFIRWSTHPLLPVDTFRVIFK